MAQTSMQPVDGATTIRRRKLCFVQTISTVSATILDKIPLRRRKRCFIQVITVVSAIILVTIVFPYQNYPWKCIQVITPNKSPFDLHITPKMTNSGNRSNQLSTCFSSQPFSSRTVSKWCRQPSLIDTFQCRHLMTVNNNKGRTGNEIFQVAALLSVASYHGYTAVIDSSMSITDIFDLPNLLKNTHLILNKKTAKKLTEPACCTYNERVRNISHNFNWTLVGYLQSWKYFEGAKNIVRNGLRIKDHLTSEVRRFIDSTVCNNTQAVCIHVRRGDFLKTSKWGFTVAPLEYIKRAMEYFRNKYDHVHFFVVSDDKYWCKQNLRCANVTISPFKTVALDMALMVNSDHAIVTSGTFGWWGAWLSGGETLYWMGYPGKGTVQGNNTVFDDYYPRNWIGLW